MSTLRLCYSSTMETWPHGVDEHFLDFFADKGFRAVAVSLRGHGGSTLSQPLNSCSIADYVDDVRTAVDMLGDELVLIGHSMGCNVVQKYLEKHPAPAAVLMAPSTPRGTRRITLHMVRRHPRIVLRANTSGSTADLFNIAGPQQHGPGDDSDADDHQESDDNPGGHRSQRCGTATQGVRVRVRVRHAQSVEAVILPLAGGRRQDVCCACSCCS